MRVCLSQRNENTIVGNAVCFVLKSHIGGDNIADLETTRHCQQRFYLYLLAMHEILVLMMHEILFTRVA